MLRFWSELLEMTADGAVGEVRDTSCQTAPVLSYASVRVAPLTALKSTPPLRLIVAPLTTSRLPLNFSRTTRPARAPTSAVMFDVPVMLTVSVWSGSVSVEPDGRSALCEHACGATVEFAPDVVIGSV